MLLRSLSVRHACVLGAVLAFGCGAPSSSGGPSTSADEIVDVPQSEVERESIGNTWLYAHASWIESMHTTATGEDLDISETYWTYWHWFDQISEGTASSIATGGNWQTANAIVKKYGVIAEPAFVTTDTDSKISTRQASALAAVNASLAEGALSTSAARRDRALVRQELARAWGLSADVTSMLDRVFGADASRTFTQGGAPPETNGTPIQRADDFAVAYPGAMGQRSEQRVLTEAMIDWRQVYYPNVNDRRAFQIRVQHALHDAQPVIITWFVDFNALESRDSALRGAFSRVTLNELGPGLQGGHTTIIESYQALAGGRMLEAGKTLDPTNPDDKTLQDTALLSSAEVQFFRVKNSWGVARPERPFAPGMPTYHDLYLDYLDGPVAKCVERDGTTDTSSCPTTTTPLKSVVLPPGY